MSEFFQFKDEVLTFSKEVGVPQAAELYEVLNEFLESGGTKISIDASAVSRVDGAILQLMAALAAEVVDEQHGEIEWVNPSETFVSAAKMLDLHGSLHLH